MLLNKLTKSIAVRVRGSGPAARKELPVREYATIAAHVSLNLS